MEKILLTLPHTLTLFSLFLNTLTLTLSLFISYVYFVCFFKCLFVVCICIFFPFVCFSL